MSEFENDFSPIWGPVLDGVFLDSDPVFGSPLNKMQQGEYLNYEVNILEISFICQVTGRGSILQKKSAILGTFGAMGTQTNFSFKNEKTRGCSK